MERKDKIKIIALAIIIAAVTIFYGYVFIKKLPDSVPVFESKGAHENFLPEAGNEGANESPLENKKGGSNKSSSDQSSGSLMSPPSAKDYYESTGRILPDDLDSRPCGFYTGEYGVCSGTCPSGECISEGRSCYCKLA